MRSKIFIFALVFSASSAFAEEEPLWEVGVGVGHFHYEQYPASGEAAEIAVPFPTFQYRGDVVRADDREGARAYLVRSSDWSLEFSGAGFPTLDSKKNKARQGMEPIPWIVQLGPQIKKNWNDDWQFRLSLFQNISTDLYFTKLCGEYAEGSLTYRWTNDGNLFLASYFWEGKLSLSVSAASKELLGIFYDVPLGQVNSDRPFFDSRSGFLDHELSYFQQIKKDRWSLYMDISYRSYDISANRASPLHKSDHNLTTFVGLAYLLRESARKEKFHSEW